MHLEIFAAFRSILLNSVRFCSKLSSIVRTNSGALDALGDVGRLARHTHTVSKRHLETSGQQWDVDSRRRCEIFEHAPSTAPWTGVVGKLVNRSRATKPRNFSSYSLDFAQFCSILLDLSSIIWTKLGASDALGDVGSLARRTRVVSNRHLETNRQQWDVDSWRSCEILEHAPTTAPWTRVVGKLVNRPRATRPSNFARVRSILLNSFRFCPICPPSQVRSGSHRTHRATWGV